MSSASSSDSTVIAGRPAMLGSQGNGPSESHCCKVAMCQGSGPHMSKETQSLLRSRLRIASLLLGLGFGAFFVRQLFVTKYDNAICVFMLVFHGLLTIALLLVGGGMCHKRKYTLSTLRIAELVVFGLPAIFFALLQSIMLLVREPYLTGFAAPWMLLILVYSLYIPNTW